MIGSRTAACLALLCALVFCAFAAQGASAKGTTAFTCEKVPPELGDFEDPHCDTEKAKGEYKHVSLAKNPTEIDGTNAGTKNSTTEHTAAIFHTIRAGVKVTWNAQT